MTTEAACAHLHVEYQTEPTTEGHTRGWWACRDCATKFVPAVLALVAPSLERKACPCLHTTPCDPLCTCVQPLSSSGCSRCCSYGSPEQQRAAADRIVALLAPEGERVKITGRVITDPWAEVDTLRAQLDEARRRMDVMTEPGAASGMVRSMFEVADALDGKFFSSRAPSRRIEEVVAALRARVADLERAPALVAPEGEQAQEKAARDLAALHVGKVLAERDALRERERGLREELRALADSAASYMDYHAAKFYSDVTAHPTGLWPAISRARAALAPPPSEGSR